MRNLWYLLFAVLLVACSTEEDNNILPENGSTEEVDNLPFDQKLARHITGALSIPATEKYTTEIFEAECNGDDSTDMVVAINLMQRADDAAANSGNVAKFVSMGYMGNYNYIVYVDGMTKRMSHPIPIPSSAKAPLEIRFEHIISGRQKDILVDYRIRNSGFRAFFSIAGEQMVQVLQLKLFDGVGTLNPEAYYLRFEPGSYSLAQDIVVYKGTYENTTFDNPDDVYSFDPGIKPTDEVDRRWFFNDQQYKYFTKKDE